MYKAKLYNVSYKKDLVFKITEMLRLANILKKIHERGYTHDRKNYQTYLRKDDYDVDTLEPIHHLIENAIYDGIENR